MEATSAWERVKAAFACAHEEEEVRYRTVANKVRHFYRQCLRCGASLGAVRKDTIPLARQWELVAFDEGLRQAYQDRISAALERERAAERTDWFDRYNGYLRTDGWRARRQRVLARAGHVCEGCGDRRATQVHHLTYARVGREMLFDLVAICDECHAELHPHVNADVSAVGAVVR